MADGVFNIAKGKAGYYASQAGTGNAALIVVVLQATEADGTLVDYDDLGTLLAQAGNTEWTATGYARKTITSVTETVDDTNDRADYDFADQTWTGISGATASVKLLVCYDADTTTGTDSNIIPLTHHDFAVTPDGTDVTAQLNTAGFYRAA